LRTFVLRLSAISCAVVQDVNRVAGAGYVGQADDHDGRGRTGCFQLVAHGVVHGAHLAVSATGEDDVAAVQGTVLNQDRGHGAATTIELGFDHDAARRFGRVSA